MWFYLLCVLSFFWHVNFSDIGGLSRPQDPFQLFRSWRPPHKIQIIGIRFRLRLHGNEDLTHISVSNFCNNIQQNSCMCYDLHRELSWAKREDFFFIFLQGFFGRRVFRSDMKLLLKKNNKYGFLVKKYPNSKKKSTESESR